MKSVSPDTLSVPWMVPPAPPPPGPTVARIVNEQMILLRDEYSEEAMLPLAEWMAGNDVDGDGSYA